MAPAASSADEVTAVLVGMTRGHSGTPQRTRPLIELAQPLEVRRPLLRATKPRPGMGARRRAEPLDWWLRPATQAATRSVWPGARGTAAAVVPRRGCEDTARSRQWPAMMTPGVGHAELPRIAPHGPPCPAVCHNPWNATAACRRPRSAWLPDPPPGDHRRCVPRPILELAGVSTLTMSHSGQGARSSWPGRASGLLGPRPVGQFAT